MSKTSAGDATVSQNFTADLSQFHWMSANDKNKSPAFLAPSCSASSVFRTAFLRLWGHSSSAHAQFKRLMVEQLSKQWDWLHSRLWPRLIFFFSSRTRGILCLMVMRLFKEPDAVWSLDGSLCDKLSMNLSLTTHSLPGDFPFCKLINVVSLASFEYDCMFY